MNRRRVAFLVFPLVVTWLLFFDFGGSNGENAVEPASAQPEEERGGNTNDGSGSLPDAPEVSDAPPVAHAFSSGVLGERVVGLPASRRAVRVFANGAANRSPPRPKRPLPPPRAVAAEGGSRQATANCWLRDGRGAGVPTWIVPFFTAVAPQYDAIQAVVQEDPWQMLIGWIPSRFMGPQAPGRKANGDVMIPPTRGRNPQTYLDEYNASWSALVNDGNTPHVFQLTHRNALRVCIRERLKLHLLFCSPSNDRLPLPIHYCPCRHCSEPRLRQTTSNLFTVYSGIPSKEWGALPTNAKPVVSRLVVPSAKDHPPFKGSCVEALSAPWLASRDAFPTFPYEGLHNDMARLLEAQADPTTRVVIFSIFNAFWIDHLHNWVFSIVRNARLTNFVIATMDDDALAMCIANRLPCFNASAFAEFEPDMVVGGAGFRSGDVRKVTEAMSWIKPRLALDVLRRGFPFFMIDLDITWNKFPMEEILKQRGVDLLHQCDSASVTSINSGFVLSFPNERVIRFFENMMTLPAEEDSDQTAMKLFSRYDTTHGMTTRCLNGFHFNMKCSYKVPKSVKVVNGVETFSWRTFDRDRSKFAWMMLHATCLNGAKAKMLYFRTMNAWFLDDLDAMTTSKSGGSREYCVLLPSGQAVRQSGVTTTHSSKYPTGTDPTFLKERH